MVKGHENLIPFSERTEDEQKEIRKSGGKASGVARRRKADLRRMAQDILDGTYTDKNGKQFTGAELIQNGLMQNLSDPKSKNWGKAMDIFIQLTSANMSPEQKAKLKAETQLAKAKAKAADPKQAEKMASDNFIEALNDSATDDWQETSDDTDTDV